MAVEHWAQAAGENARAASASAMRTRPRRKGDVDIGFVFIFISYRRNFLGHSVTFHVRNSSRTDLINAERVRETLVGEEGE